MKKVIASVCAMIICYSALVLPSAYADPSSAEIAVTEAVEERIAVIPEPPVPLPGGSTTDDNNADMESALVKVKQRMEIPSKLTEFDFNSSSSNGVQSYSFNWNDKDGNESLSVSVTGEMITSYSHYKNSENSKPSFGKYTIDQLKAAADKEIVKLNPSFAKKYKLELQSAYLSDESVTFKATRVENGIEVTGNSLSVSMNKNTGELTRMSTRWWSNASFKAPTDKITLTAAQKAFISLYSLEPKYVLSYDYETEEYTATLIYTPTGTDSIDAFTGKLSTMYEDMKKSSLTSSYERGEKNAADVAVAEETAVANPTSGGGEVSFTKAELDALKKNESLLSKEEVTAKLKKDKYLKLTNEYMLEYSNLNISKNTPSGYSWSMSFIVNTEDISKYMNVTVDAETGKIMSFNKSQYSKKDKEKKKTFKISEADKLAAEAYKYYMGELTDNYRPIEDEEPVVPLNGEKTVKATEIEYSKSYSHRRYVNDIPCDADYARITIDNNGEVSGFSYQYTDIKFPSAERLTVDEAFAQLFTQQPLELRYEGYSDKVGKTKTYLSYACDGFYLNAKTGKLCSYNGTPIEDNTDNPSEIKYSDLSGNYAEKYIYKLAQYGIVLETKDGKFNPSAAITEKEFRSLMQSVINGGNYKYIYGSNNGKKDSDYASSVSRAEAAKIYVSQLGGEEFAEMKSIFKAEFADVPDGSEYVGYVAIAANKKVMSGDANGKFNPEVKITRARAMDIA